MSHYIRDVHARHARNSPKAEWHLRRDTVPAGDSEVQGRNALPPSRSRHSVPIDLTPRRMTNKNHVRFGVRLSCFQPAAQMAGFARPVHG
jgi:hypothetical protein